MPLDLVVSRQHELTQAQAQALVDLEVCCLDLGIVMAIFCRLCHTIGDPAKCDGRSEPHDDGTRTFGVDCRCTRRAFRGHLVAPRPPRELRDRRIDMTVRPTVNLTRQQMRIFTDAAAALHQLKLFYAMRCLACQMEDRDHDGIRGAAESNANRFVLDCDCTHRIYVGADAPLVN